MKIKRKPKVSAARCFPKDLGRIQALAGFFENKEQAGFNQEHVITRALTALEEKVQYPVPQEVLA